MSRIEKAREFKRKINANLQATRKLIRVDELTPAELEGMISLYDEYNPNAYPYVAGELFSFRGKMYKAITTHTSQEDWVPSDLPAVYDPITPPDTIAPWEQRYGHNPYREGDRIIWNDLIYVNILSTTYSPTDFPQGWLLEEEVNVDPEEPELPADPEPAGPAEWAQPTGGHDAYQLGDKVTFQNAIWTSTAANNTWKPGEYGWTQDQ